MLFPQQSKLSDLTNEVRLESKSIVISIASPESSVLYYLE